jgi:arginyl-tRNA synthetase
MNLAQLLERTLHDALIGLTADPSKYSSLVRATANPQHGDYQVNAAMPLAKLLERKPVEVANDVAHRLAEATGEFLEPPVVAGPGFINLRLRTDWLAKQLQAMAADERLGVSRAEPARRFVIDFSSPNVAKPLHVGHLRSTIIGDALTRLLRFLGHTVITDNHLGDWGTQFGKLLYGYKNFLDRAALEKDPVREMVRLYVHVNKLTGEKEEGDEDTAQLTPEAQQHLDQCRLETAKLHEGDPENVALWKQFMPWCMEEIERIYRRLDVKFDHQHGESYYNPMLPEVVADLLKQHIAQPSRGAAVVFFHTDPHGRLAVTTDPELSSSRALVQKKDGAYTYMATDSATIRYRVDHFRPDVSLYVVGAPQSLHFEQLFAIARRWGYDWLKLEHIAFGSVLGPDRKPLGARKGGAVELGVLLDQAEERAARVYEEICREARERGEEVPEISEEEKRVIARTVGIGAVKYTDLSQNRTSDYVFDLNKMVSLDGNTATYMQYQYARCRSIFRKGDEDPQKFRTNPPLPSLGSPHERALALQLLRFEESLQTAAAEYKPHFLAAYLWDLCKTYSGFFTNCPVLKAETPELRQSRLLLCDLTARVIQQTLNLLGIRTVERM